MASRAVRRCALFVANLPTEEVYTTPDPARVSGQVRLTRPALIGGRPIEDVELSFCDGRVVEISGPPEASALREFIARDAGARRLGELALVDAGSRAAHLGRAFGGILLDENAACHIALGHGFARLVPDGGTGANVSAHHVDVMIGSPQVHVTGSSRDGHTHTLLREDRWSGRPA